MSALQRIQENRKLALDLMAEGAPDKAAIYIGENILFWKHAAPRLLTSIVEDLNSDRALAAKIAKLARKESLTAAYISTLAYLDRLVHLGCSQPEERIQAVTLASNALQLSEFLRDLEVGVEPPEAIVRRLVAIFGGRKDLVVSAEEGVVRNNPLYISVFRIAA